MKMPWKRDKEGIRKMKEIAGLALGVVKKAVTLAAELSGDAGVPGLSAALSALGEILEAIQVGIYLDPPRATPTLWSQTMSETIEGVDTLRERLEGLVKILEGFRSRPRDRPLPEEMRQRLEQLTS